MYVRDLMWHRDSMFSEYPKDLKPEPKEVNYAIENIRLSHRLHLLQNRTFPAGGSLNLTRSIQKLKKRRRQSFRYRNIEIFRSIPTNILFNYSRNDFKDYLKQVFVPTIDKEEQKLCDDAFSGRLREQFLKCLQWKHNLNKTLADDVIESDTDQECDDPTAL